MSDRVRKAVIAGEGLRNPAIECEHVTKIYRSVWAPRKSAVYALRDISLSVSRGRIVGLIGPNGAGKSTLLSLMAGLIRSTQGRISLCGHPAASRKARQSLGYMPEQPAFLERYSTRAVLRYHAALLGLSNTAIKTQVDRIIEDFQMHEFVDRPCSEYSQGMRQRLALGIATMNDPQVLLLDEPSNGLDPLSIIQLRERLQQLRDRGTTIMVSSHRLGELEKLTSHYLFIYQGRLIDISDGQPVGQAGYLHVTLAPDGGELAPELLSQWRIANQSKEEVTIAVNHVTDVPHIVKALVQGGALIMGVRLQEETIEELFLRLCHKKETPCEPTNC